MRYETINTAGQVVFWTEYSECVPSSDKLSAMTSAGYRHKVDGKIIAASNVLKAVGVDKPAAFNVHKDQNDGKHEPCNKVGKLKLF